MAKTDVLSLAILGMLSEQPLHGYQIRKRLGSELGPFRALSYGSLYPGLKRMVAAGLIATDDSDDSVIRAAASKRSRISYQLTEAGKARLEEELASSGASSWDDDAFDVRFSMFERTDSATRLRILEGRRSRLAERLEEVSEGLQRVRERHDAYTTELHRHGLERVEREVEWLDRLIENERSAPRGDTNRSASAGNN
ncbi:PadR family transcriptional regulator [Demequina sp. SO4-13]